MGPAMVAQALAVAIWPAFNSTWPAAAGATAAAIITATLGSADSYSNNSTVGAGHSKVVVHENITIDNKKDLHREEGHARDTSWAPFWATVPAWSATVLLMLGPATLLVRPSLPLEYFGA